MKPLTRTFVLLNQQEIKDQLEKRSFRSPYTLHVLSTVDSTNRFVKDLVKSPSVEICCAENQTHGRGRFGRSWHSPFGENIYCSSRWTLNATLSKLRGLSLVSSLALFASIKEFTHSEHIKVKWPNDIWWGDKKLSGILIETVAESNARTEVIIGIGLNVNSDTERHLLKDKAWCSLFEITKQEFNRNHLIASLLKHLESYLHRFLTRGLVDFLTEWNQYDYLGGKEITVTQAEASITGVARGVNEVGQLILEDAYGVEHRLSSGDTSLA